MTSPCRAIGSLLAALSFALAGCGVDAGGDEPPAKPIGEGAEMKTRAGDETKTPDGEHEHTNRLVHESSPYLLQHAHNPVDWYPWGEEAFEAAREQDKPIFLSIGYSTCHWCHVMERESFENERIAEVLNEHFISIKVDREERPDVDAIYMAAVQATTGHGGWPMSVFMTPEGKPFFLGTYFPPEDRGGRLGFRSLLERISGLWKTRRSDLLSDAERVTDFLRKMDETGEAEELGPDVLDAAFRTYESVYDPEHGGFGRAPKFPRTHNLSFLLRYHGRTGNEAALSMSTATLERMWRGGMYDHLGGGFHRYSTDRVWLLPHFEKMLYDQALIIRTLVETYEVTRDPFFADVARDILRYVLRDMTDEAGGFYSAEDADSEGEEGKFYVWSAKEIRELLGEEDGGLFSRVYGVDPEGNFVEEATRVRTGENILHLSKPIPEVAVELEMEPSDLERKLEGLREKLFRAREERIHPYKDDKILVDWNGLMISSLALAGGVLGDESYTDAARRAARFVLRECRTEKGRLLHRYRNGQADIPAFLDDYAFLGLGLLDLYEATFEAQWLRECRDLAREMIVHFWDEEKGGFFFTADDSEELLTRKKEIYDGAIPSGNSVAALLLLRLGRLTADTELEERGGATIRAFSQAVAEGPANFPMMLQALDFRIGPTREVVLAGSEGDPELAAMIRAVRIRFLPRTVVALHPEGNGSKEIEALVPYLETQRAVDGKATAYVCRDYVCRLPVHGTCELVELLEGDGEQSEAPPPPTSDPDSGSD